MGSRTSAGGNDRVAGGEAGRVAGGEAGSSVAGDEAGIRVAGGESGSAAHSARFARARVTRPVRLALVAPSEGGGA